mmetsp:Transcript_20684/g.60448  ORF Transcript_20684/g.60448 Transcript_20684/m.60448 type:complete len:216 (+) Transcript_20684:621-1268(+)
MRRVPNTHHPSLVEPPHDTIVVRGKGHVICTRNTCLNDVRSAGHELTAAVLPPLNALGTPLFELVVAKVEIQRGNSLIVPRSTPGLARWQEPQRRVASRTSMHLHQCVREDLVRVGQEREQSTVRVLVAEEGDTELWPKRRATAIREDNEVVGTVDPPSGVSQLHHIPHLVHRRHLQTVALANVLGMGLAGLLERLKDHAPVQAQAIEPRVETVV